MSSFNTTAREAALHATIPAIFIGGPIGGYGLDNKIPHSVEVGGIAVVGIWIVSFLLLSGALRGKRD